MHQNQNMPPPSHNPLEDLLLDEDQAYPESPQRNSPHRVNTAATPPEDDHDTIQKGMPGRNLKTWGVVTLGCVVIAALVWPKSQAPAPKPDAVAVKQGSSIADDLAGRVRATPPEEVPPALPVKPVLVEKSPTNHEDEAAKQALIIASPMGSDVDLRNNGASGGSGQIPQRANANPAAEFGEKQMREALERQQQGFMGVAQLSQPQSKGAHEDFLSAAGNAKIEAPVGMIGARGPYSIYEGTLIRTVLTRSLHTDVPGRITAKVMSDVFDSVTLNTLLIPRGSEVTCHYQSELLTGQEVVLAACDRLRLPNGKSFSLVGTPAGDVQGAAGLPAEVNNHFWKMFKTSLILGAASLLMPRQDRNISTSTNAAGGMQSGGSILGIALYDTIKQVMSNNAKIAPTASVEIGTPFTLTIARDVEMEPYRGR